MIDRRLFLAGGVLGGALITAPLLFAAPSKRPKAKKGWQLSEAEWKKRLTAKEFRILREAGTEPPYSHRLLKENRTGTFDCAGCALPLFSSKTKYNSHTGWPSFWAPLPGATATMIDHDIGLARTEVHCARCGGHQGHIFNDGPKPTGKRYCINGIALNFSAA